MLQEKPLVSVCIPSYNYEEFVGQAIQSVLGQTYSNFELIVVDDASVDHSVEVIKSFEDSRIQLTVMEENTGFGAAEYMFEQVRGEYVCWLDADDVWEETLLEKYIAFLEEHKEYGVCLCKPLMIDGSGTVLQEEPFYSAFSGENMKKEEWFRKIYRESNCFCTSSMCIRREVFDQVGKFRFQYKQIHDYEYWFRLLQVAEIYVFPESLARYRAHWEEEKTNVSTPTPEMLNRFEVERAYIFLEAMENLGEEFFVKAFSDLLRIQPGEDGFCLECEKFWIIKSSYTCPPISAVFYYYRHYRDKDFKYYSKNVYGITNNMIYQMAGEINRGAVENKVHDDFLMRIRAETLLDGISFNPENKSIIVWGAGERTEGSIKNGLFDFPIEYIVDANKSRKSLGQIRIVLPEEIQDWKNYYVIVTLKAYRDYIFQILLEKGLQYGKDYIGYEETCGLQTEAWRTRLLRDINTEGIRVMLATERPIGDMCYIMGFLKAYKEKVNQSLVVYIIGSYGKEIWELCPYIERVEMVPTIYLNSLEDIFTKEKDRICDMRFCLEGTGSLEPTGEVKRLFHLPEETRFDRFIPEILPDQGKCVNLFRSFGLRRGKTVFIVPYADWLGPIGKRLKSVGFWTELCAALSEEGYDAIFYSEEEIVPGVPYTFLELSDLPQLIELCGNVVGMRTGLLNFIAMFTDVAIQCLWPGNDNLYFNTDTWKKFSKRGDLPQTARSRELVDAGLALAGAMGRREKIYEFICQSDERDIETIRRNLDRTCELREEGPDAD